MRIRTVFLALSPIVRDIILRILPRSVDLEVVADFETQSPPKGILKDLDPDVIIIGLLAGEIDSSASLLLSVVPRAKVIALSSEGRNAFIHEMRPHRSVIKDISPHALVSAISGGFWNETKSI